MRFGQAECHGRISRRFDGNASFKRRILCPCAGWRQATARITADTDFVISFMFSEKNEYFSNACGFRTFFGKCIEYNRNFSGNLDYLT